MHLVETGNIRSDLVEEGVECLLPRPAMHRDRVGDHPIHVEDHRPAPRGVDVRLPALDPEQGAQPLTPVAATPWTK